MEEQRKRIFKYMNWPTDCDCGICSYCLGGKNIQVLDEKDMILIMRSLRRNREWRKFIGFCKVILPPDVRYLADIISYIMRPEKFFDLLNKWLLEKETQGEDLT
jgi:hypothetical protein